VLTAVLVPVRAFLSGMGGGLGLAAFVSVALLVALVRAMAQMRQIADTYQELGHQRRIYAARLRRPDYAGHAHHVASAQLPINGQPRAAMGCRAARIKPQTIVAAIGLVCLWSYFVTPRR
jgi:hypothetical protein